LERWRQREAAVLGVVEKATDAVVAVTDGESYGSGVIVSPDGLVLTAGHVIMSEASEFTLQLPNGRTAQAKPLGKNLNQDAGMLQITDAGPWPYVDVADGRGIQRGDWVVAMGHSGGHDLGRRPPVRLGRVVRLERDAVTSDSPIIGGDSGGPLFNLAGQVIGIHSSIGESIAENRHVSIQIFLRDWDRLKGGESWGRLPGTPEPPSEDGSGSARPNPDGNSGDRRAPRGAPGGNRPPSAEGTPKSESAPKSEPNIGSAVLGVELDLADSQPIIRVIQPNSAAARVGLRVGDVVESFNGVGVTSPQGLVEQIAGKRAGDSVKVIVRRGDSRLEYQIILGQLDTRGSGRN
jgi:serine protease Do